MRKPVLIAALSLTALTLHAQSPAPGRDVITHYDKMEKIARLIHQMSWDLANQDARPRLAGRAMSEM